MVDIAAVGVIHLRMTASTKSDLARIEVSLGGPTIWVVVKLETGAWPFRIENSSDYTVEFSQVVSFFSANKNTH